MARFGRDFVRAATQPAFTQGLFTAAQQIGSAPARRRELERFNQTSRVESQADASVVAGDPNALAMNIRRLQELMEQAPTIEEKRALNARISQLRSLTPATEAKGLQNEIRAVSTIDNTLETLDTTTEQGMKVKEALEARKIQLLQNPDVEQGYREAQVNEFAFKRQEQAMLESNFLKENAPMFQEAVRSGDVDTVLDSVPDEFKNVAQEYITGFIRNNEVMETFRQNSIALKTAPMTDAELESIVNQLPDDVRQSVAPLVNQYKKAAEGWNAEKGEWRTDKLQAAKNAEKALNSRIDVLTNQVLLRDLDTKRDKEIRTERDILQLELEMKAPVSETDVNREALALVGQDKNKVTPEIREQARTNVERRRNESILEQIELLDPERSSEIAEEDSPYQINEILEAEEGMVVYTGGDYRDPNNYRKATEDEVAQATGKETKEEELARVLELFRLKKENKLPQDRMIEYANAWRKYGNPERAKERLGN